MEKMSVFYYKILCIKGNRIFQKNSVEKIMRTEVPTILTDQQLAERYIIQAKDSSKSYVNNFDQGKIPEAQWTEIYSAISRMGSEMMQALNFPSAPDTQTSDFKDENVDAIISQTCREFVRLFHAAFPDGKVEVVSDETAGDQIKKLEELVSVRNQLMSMLESRQRQFQFEIRKEQRFAELVRE